MFSSLKEVPICEFTLSTLRIYLQVELNVMAKHPEVCFLQQSRSIWTMNRSCI